MKRITGRKFLLAAPLIAGAMGIGSASAAVPAKDLAAESQMVNSSITELTDDTRVFTVDKSLDVKKVSFQNHFGFDVVGHMCLPKDFDAKKQYAAVVITGPFGAVKEQSSGLYAQELARNGFVAVAFDPSTTGESSGARRNVGSPELFTEVYHAAVDFVSNLKFVSPERVGAMGICGLSGMALTAATSDTRIKAVATSAMYDMSESISMHYKGSYYTPEQRAIVLRHLAGVRDQEAKSGKQVVGYHELPVLADGSEPVASKLFPDALPADADSVTKEFFNYYVGRANHPRAINSRFAWDGTTPYGFFDFRLMDNLDRISVPVLMITGSKAHSKYFTDDVIAKIPGNNKREIVVPDATHTDLYDQMDKIPFKDLVSFYKTNLK